MNDVQPSPPLTRWNRIRARSDSNALATDAVLAAVVAVGVLPQVMFHFRHHDPQSVGYALFSALLVVPLVWRRRFPMTVFGVVATAALAQWFLGVQLAADVSVLLCLYTVATSYPMRKACLAAAAAVVGAWLAAVRWPRGFHWSEMWVILAVFVLASLMSGAYVRSRRIAVEVLTERADRLRWERDQQSVIAAGKERTRIAREMHDVVAHSLAVMITLSDAASLKVTTQPDRAAEAMSQVSSTGRETLDEIRRLLGVLRTEPAAVLRPQPSISDIDLLLERVRETGLRTELDVTGPLDAVPAGLGLAAYRITQEAVTNTLKHSVRATGVFVAVAVGKRDVTVRICDDGAPSTGQTDHGTGHGLLGMRERASAYGGVVSCGPSAEGGWRVEARLPLVHRQDRVSKAVD